MLGSLGVCSSPGSPCLTSLPTLSAVTVASLAPFLWQTPQAVSSGPAPLLPFSQPLPWGLPESWTWAVCPSFIC